MIEGADKMVGLMIGIAAIEYFYRRLHDPVKTPPMLLATHYPPPEGV